jgi:hypothetical protein
MTVTASKSFPALSFSPPAVKPSIGRRSGIHRLAAGAACDQAKRLPSEA